MKLLAGLGNPGVEYEQTRHNAGFMFLDFVAQNLSLDEPWQEREKFDGQVARKGDLFLLKPMTFMNNSGTAVRKLKNFYKIATANLTVVHDDLDLILGNWKIQQKIGPKVHNGLLSLEAELGSADFWRLRLGVDSRTPTEREQIPPENYVLGKFPADQLAKLEATFAPAWTEVLKMLG